MRPRRLLLAVVAVGLVYLLITLAHVVIVGARHEVSSADAVVVLGAAQYDGRPSAQLAARLDHVLTVWESGDVVSVIVTGGRRPGDRFTEAEASRKYLVDHGVPDEVILAEDAGSTTYESLQGVSALVSERGIESVVLVTDPHHALRSQIIARRSGIENVSVSTTPSSVVHGWDNVRRHVVEAGGVAVGRLIGFRLLSGVG
jgi:uncharacterized SAM-binding protein YcdF (DUF218 family)